MRVKTLSTSGNFRRLAIFFIFLSCLNITISEAEEARNFGLKAIPLKRSPFWNDPSGKKIRPEKPADVEKQ